MLKFYKRDFIYWNAVFALGFSDFIVAYIQFHPWPIAFRSVDNLNDFFVTLASVAGVLAGFTIASFTFLAGYIEKPIFKSLRQNSQSKKIWQTMNSLTVVLFVITLMSLIYLLLNFECYTFNFMMLFLCLFASFLMANLIFIINSFIEIDHLNSDG
ncbi:MAG: hypothetical protein DI585_01480 [Pseudomonas fluorescens]|nr:MAG: hypothetical protein DI585_01480 [Pseudomonas fluorescens]